MTRRRPVQIPNTAGWRAPWRHTWGPLSDGRSRLSRLARRIEGELSLAYVITTPLQRRRSRSAARLMALAEMTMLNIGKDRKATRRTLTALQGAAARELAGLDPIPTKPVTLAERLTVAG